MQGRYKCISICTRAHIYFCFASIGDRAFGLSTPIKLDKREITNITICPSTQAHNHHSEKTKVDMACIRATTVAKIEVAIARGVFCASVSSQYIAFQLSVKFRIRYANWQWNELNARLNSLTHLLTYTCLRLCRCTPLNRRVTGSQNILPTLVAA